MVKYRRINNTRPKAFVGESIVAAGIGAAATLASAAISSAATTAGAKRQALAQQQAAQTQAEALKKQNDNANKLQEKQIEFTQKENEQNRDLQNQIQMNLQMLQGQQNENARLDAARIQVKKGGNPFMRAGLSSFLQAGNNMPFEVTDGGYAVPLGFTKEGYGLFMLRGDNHEEYHRTKGGNLKSGVGIKAATGQVVEGEGGKFLQGGRMNTAGRGEGSTGKNPGELMMTTPNDILFISKHKLGGNVFGYNPTLAVLSGQDDPMTAYEKQEYIKAVDNSPVKRKYKCGGAVRTKAKYGIPDWDPDNPYHYHTNEGKKVVITPEDWEANKGKPYFKEVEAAVNAERAAYPGPEYEIDPKFVSALNNNYASQLANTSGALNYRNFARQLPKGYSISNQGVIFDKEGNAYVQDWYNGGYRYTYNKNNPTTFTFTFGPNNKRNVNFYPVNMEKRIKAPLPVDETMNIAAEKEKVIQDNMRYLFPDIGDRMYYYPDHLWPENKNGKVIFKSGTKDEYNNTRKKLKEVSDRTGVNYVDEFDKGIKKVKPNINQVAIPVKTNNPKPKGIKGLHIYSWNPEDKTFNLKKAIQTEGKINSYITDELKELQKRKAGGSTNVLFDLSNPINFSTDTIAPTVGGIEYIMNNREKQKCGGRMKRAGGGFGGGYSWGYDPNKKYLNTTPNSQLNHLGIYNALNATIDYDPNKVFNQGLSGGNNTNGFGEKTSTGLSTSAMNYIGAGLDTAGALGGAIITALGNRAAAKYSATGLRNATNATLAGADALRGINPNLIRRSDFAAAHAMPALIDTRVNLNPQLASVERATQRLRHDIARGSGSAAAGINRYTNAETNAYDQRSKIYSAGLEYLNHINEFNAKNIQDASLKNAMFDNQAGQNYLQSRLDLLKYNNDIENQKVGIKAGALANQALGLAGISANRVQANTQSFGNVLQSAGNSFANAMRQNVQNRNNWAMMSSGLTNTQKIDAWANAGNYDMLRDRAAYLQTIADTNKAAREELNYIKSLNIRGIFK